MSSQVVESQASRQQQGVIKTAPTRASRSQLVQRLMAAQDNLPGFINDLLTTQAVSVVGTEAAAFVIERQGPAGEGDAQPKFNLRPIAHMRPDDSDDAVRQQALEAFKELILPCVQQDKDGAVEITAADETGESQFCLITLLRSEGNSVAVSAVITRCADNDRARQRLMSMQLVAGYFELYGLRRSTEQTKGTIQRQTRALQLVNSVANADGFKAAATALCNELAQRTGASRVSIGWIKGKNVKIHAISHTEKFDKKQELVVQLQRVMEECDDQENVVAWHPDGPQRPEVTREAQALSRQNGGQSVVSLPLRRKDEIVGIVTMEFDPKINLDDDALAALTVAVDLVSPSLWDRYQNDRWLITKAGISARHFGEAVVGPRYMITKVVIIILISLGIFISVYSPMYKVSAPFTFVPIVKRDVAAPVEGYIEQVNFKPGDRVEAGQVLLSLDVRDLLHEKLKAETEANTRAREAAKHRADGKLAEEQHALEQQRGALQEAADLQRQIDKRTIVAPISGFVLKGDLTDKIGSPVKLGEVLFEIGEQTGLEAEILVAERDIQDVQHGERTGYLATTSLPNQPYELKITRIVPIGEPVGKGGDNVFKVYAELPEQSESWYPGLAGEARLRIENRSLVRIWTGRLVDYLQLKFWL